jgi:hypothetical protein
MNQQPHQFYALLSPFWGERCAIYGRPEWDRQYGRAEWADEVHLERITCPVNPGHRRGGARIGDLVVILPSPRIGDFTWTWYSECLVTERVLHLFRESGCTGFDARPVLIKKVKRVRKGTDISMPTLWELVVTGRGGDAHPRSGIRLFYTCEACGLKKYSSFRNGIIVDEEQWDGSDFFTVNGYPGFTLITERVRRLIQDHQLINCVLILSQELSWGETVRPEEVYKEVNSTSPCTG